MSVNDKRSGAQMKLKPTQQMDVVITVFIVISMVAIKYVLRFPIW